MTEEGDFESQSDAYWYKSGRNGRGEYSNSNRSKNWTASPIGAGRTPGVHAVGGSYGEGNNWVPKHGWEYDEYYSSSWWQEVESADAGGKGGGGGGSWKKKGQPDPSTSGALHEAYWASNNSGDYKENYGGHAKGKSKQGRFGLEHGGEGGSPLVVPVHGGYHHASTSTNTNTNTNNNNNNNNNNNTSHTRWNANKYADYDYDYEQYDYDATYYQSNGGNPKWVAKQTFEGASSSTAQSKSQTDWYTGSASSDKQHDYYWEKGSEKGKGKGKTKAKIEKGGFKGKTINSEAVAAAAAAAAAAASAAPPSAAATSEASAAAPSAAASAAPTSSAAPKAAEEASAASASTADNHSKTDTELQDATKAFHSMQADLPEPKDKDPSGRESHSSYSYKDYELEKSQSNSKSHQSSLVVIDDTGETEEQTALTTAMGNTEVSEAIAEAEAEAEAAETPQTAAAADTQEPQEPQDTQDRQGVSASPAQPPEDEPSPTSDAPPHHRPPSVEPAAPSSSLSAEPSQAPPPTDPLAGYILEALQNSTAKAGDAEAGPAIPFNLLKPKSEVKGAARAPPGDWSRGSLPETDPLFNSPMLGFRQPPATDSAGGVPGPMNLPFPPDRPLLAPSSLLPPGFLPPHPSLSDAAPIISPLAPPLPSKFAINPALKQLEEVPPKTGPPKQDVLEVARKIKKALATCATEDGKGYDLDILDALAAPSEQLPFPAMATALLKAKAAKAGKGQKASKDALEGAAKAKAKQVEVPGKIKSTVWPIVECLQQAPSRSLTTADLKQKHNIAAAMIKGLLDSPEKLSACSSFLSISGLKGQETFTLLKDVTFDEVDQAHRAKAAKAEKARSPAAPPITNAKAKQPQPQQFQKQQQFQKHQLQQHQQHQQQQHMQQQPHHPQQIPMPPPYPEFYGMQGYHPGGPPYMAEPFPYHDPGWAWPPMGPPWEEQHGAHQKGSGKYHRYKG